MVEKTYKQGMTEVWTDGDRLKVVNKAGNQWVKANVDQIFGLGEYEKMRAVAYFEDKHKNKLNKSSYTYELITGYIPARAQNDLKLIEKENSLLGKYFNE